MALSFGVRGGRTGIATIEEIVRGFVPVLARRSPRVPIEIVEQPEAFLSWGGPSQFSYQNSFRDLARSGIGFRVGGGDDPEPVGVWIEQGRDVTLVRVENPDDADQFVEVERIDKIVFRGPGGLQVQYVLMNDG